ncbi:MAG TPA: hypothetical protein PLR10_11680 [Smithella sp.]|nr:hypothetical protein [Smithella sp.]HOU51862.1 hypothetical protein [Smithella sp.]
MDNPIYAHPFQYNSHQEHGPMMQKTIQLIIRDSRAGSEYH